MYNKTFYLAGLLFVFIVKSFPVLTQSVNKSNISNENSLLYALPKTSFIVEIAYVRTMSVKGRFSEYSKKYLGYVPEIIENNIRYRIINAKVNSFTQSDPEHFYVLSPEKGDIKYDIIGEFDKKGMIITSFEQTSMTLNSTFETLPALTDINYIPFESIYKDEIDTAFKKEFRDTAWVNVPYYERNYLLKSEEDYAREAANILILLNEKLLKASFRLDPEDEYSPDVSESLINSTNQLIERYKSLFDGKNFTDTLVFNTIITPEPEKEEYEICNFSEKEGISRHRKNNPDVVFIVSSLKQLEKLKNAYSDSVVQPGRLYYRIPETCEIIVKMNDSELYKGRFSNYQSGALVAVPVKMVISK